MAQLNQLDAALACLNIRNEELRFSERAGNCICMTPDYRRRFSLPRIWFALSSQR